MTRSRLQSLRPGSDPTIGSYSPGGFQKGANLLCILELYLWLCDHESFSLFCDVTAVDWQGRDSDSQRLNDPIIEPKVKDLVQISKLLLYVGFKSFSPVKVKVINKVFNGRPNEPGKFGPALSSFI